MTQVSYSMLLRSALLLFLVLSLAQCINLPSSVIGVLPPCSLDCLQYYVYEYYPSSVCQDTTNLDCLCTHSTSSGFTIGEAALRCLVSSCTNTSAFEIPAYDICSSVPGALAETHSTLTATLMAATTVIPSSLPQTITPASPSSVPTSIVFSSVSSTLSSLSTTQSPSSTSSPSATTTPQPQVTSGASPVRHHSSLTSGQVIGIVCGGVASAVFSFAFLALIFCVRRRRKRNEEEKDWPIIDEIMESQDTSGTSHPSDAFHNATMVGQASTEGFDVPSTEDQRRSYWRKSIKPEEIGVAVSPEITQQSPVTPKSAKSLSQLLPEKPTYSLWPAPLDVNQQTNTRDKKRMSTEIAEDVTRRPPRIVSSRTGNGLPTDPRARMYALERRRSMQRMPLTPVYDNGNPDNWPRPPSGPLRGLQLQIPSKLGVQQGTYLNPYQTRETAGNLPAFHLPGPPVQQRASSRYSNTSESTDFEIDDYDYDRDSNDEPIEPSTPKPQRGTFHFRPSVSMLSPVAESPRYPPPRPFEEDDPFATPALQQGNLWPPEIKRKALQSGPRPTGAFQRTAPVQRIEKSHNHPSAAAQKEAAKDHLIAEGQSFLMTNATTPEDENVDIVSSSESCSQPSLTPPEQAAEQVGPVATKAPLTQLSSPFRLQQQPGRNALQAVPSALRPISPPQRVHSPSESLLAKRRGSETASTMLSAGLRLSPAVANRPRAQQASKVQNPRAPQQPVEDAPIGSLWETIGRGPYEAARPKPPNHSSSSSTDSSRAVVGIHETPSVNPPMSPFATKVTPTRRDNGDMILRLG